MTGNSTVPVPGGFGAAGSPNDGWHQAHHAISKAFLAVSVQWGDLPTLRRRMDELQMSVQGNVSTKSLDDRVCFSPFRSRYLLAKLAGFTEACTWSSQC